MNGMKRCEKEKQVMRCEYCGRLINDGVDGGMAKIPWGLSNCPTRDVPLHNRCLAAYVNKLEAERVKLNANSSFQGG